MVLISDSELGPPPAVPPPRSTFAGRRGVAVAVVLAAVFAFVVVSTPPWRSWWSGVPGDRPELGDLFDALAREPARVVDGRLAGGFPYAPPAVSTRGAGRRVSPDVVIAAATIEKLAVADDRPANRAALGVAYLALGEWDNAVGTLEEVVEDAPASAVFQNDLAVAYLARAATLDRGEDWVGALAAANAAIALDPHRPEPHFNRALALAGLRMSTEEVDAWTAYRAMERQEPWIEESGRRLAAIDARRSQPSSDSEDHQIIRERIEDSLLGEWGRAVERGDPAAAERFLTEAARLAERLAASGGDAMARDEIRHIRRVEQNRDRSDLNRLATGHRLYAVAREHWVANRWTDADATMSEAARYFRDTGSPYGQWIFVFHGILLQQRGEGDAAIRQLRAVTLPASEQHYFHLRGRAAWVEGYLWASQGRFDVSRPLFVRAVDEFTQAGERDYLAAAHTNLAESEWFLGNRERAWTSLAAAFSLIDALPQNRRIDHLDLAAAMSADRDLAALEFRNAMVRVARTPEMEAQAHLRRARTLVRLERSDAATADLDRAATAMSRSADPVWRDRIAPDIELARAELFSASDCPRAMQHSDAALQALARGTGTIRRGALLTIRAKCRDAMGDTEGARTDLLGAVQVFEDRRALIASAADRVQAFDLERAAFRSLLSLQVLKLNDEAGALETAERARSGVLAETWSDTPGNAPDHRRLPDGVAVVYYETLADRVLVWVLTGERREHFSRPIGEAQVRRWVTQIRREIDRGASLTALRRHSASFMDALVAPALELARAGTGGTPLPRIVFVPDGPLFGVPFSVLPDVQGRPLLETAVIGVAPSLRTLLAASTRLTGLAPASVLAIGDAHDPATSGLPMLPRADAEALAVGRLYPTSTVLTGPEATKRRFVSTPADVIHFAGHSVLNGRYPMFSRMLLAPDPEVGDSGWLMASDITPARFGRARVVVLATCEGAAGKTVEGEGAISVARAFFAAGVPAVVASLWPVDDDLQTLMTTFHRALHSERDPAQALRMGQLALFAERGPETPVRVWGGFIMLGGLTPRP